MGKDHHRAAREGTDEIGLAVMATTFAICAVFVPVAFMGGIVGKFFYPFGITVAVAVLVSLFVSFTLDPMLSSVWQDPPADAAARRCRCSAHLMRATDRGLDVMHAVYERLIRWVFGSALRWLPPTAAFDARPARQGRAASLRWHAHAARLICVGAQLLGALACAAGGQRVHPADRPGLHPAVAAHAGGREPGAQRRQGAPGRGDRRRVPRGEDHLDQRRRPGHGLRGRAQPGLAEHRAGRSQRAQAQPEGGRRRDPRARSPRSPASTSRSASTGRSTSPSSAATPKAWRSVATDFAEKVKKIPGIADVELSVKPGLPAYAVRLKPGAVRELGPDRAAARRQPARLRQRRGRHLLDDARRRAGRGAAAPARGAARAHRADAQPAGGVRQGRHADPAGRGGRRSSRWSTPT